MHSKHSKHSKHKIIQGINDLKCYYRCLNIKVEESDKLPTTLCQPCVTKVEEMHNFYNQCQDAQKILGVQFGVTVAAEENVNNHSITMAQNPIGNLIIKEDIVSTMPICSSTLSADKLLETAIKDTCILSAEDSEDSSDSDDGISEEDLSGGDDEKV